MKQITKTCRRIQYEKRLAKHIHNCSDIEALERQNHLLSRAGVSRFNYIWRLGSKL